MTTFRPSTASWCSCTPTATMSSGRPCWRRRMPNFTAATSPSREAPHARPWWTLPEAARRCTIWRFVYDIDIDSNHRFVYICRLTIAPKICSTSCWRPTIATPWWGAPWNQIQTWPKPGPMSVLSAATLIRSPRLSRHKSRPRPPPDWFP